MTDPRPDDLTRAEPMTDAEHALCGKLGECYLDYRAMLYAAQADRGRRSLPDAQQHDLREFIAHIHDLQHAVMARAAIRCYPDRYRQ